MQILRKYQLDIIFLFFALVIIVGLIFYFLEYLGEDPHNFELITAGPLLILYVAYSLELRSKVRLSERRALTGKTLTYWLALGILLFASFAGPISAKEYLSLDLFFIAFTLLLADSYWDFRKMTLGTLIDKNKI